MNENDVSKQELNRRVDVINGLIHTAFELPIGPYSLRKVDRRTFAEATVHLIPEDDAMYWKGKVPFYRALILDTIYRMDGEPHFHRHYHYGNWIVALSQSANGAGNLVPYMLHHLRRGEPSVSEQTSRISVFEAENRVDFNYIPPMLQAYWLASKRP